MLVRCGTLTRGAGRGAATAGRMPATPIGTILVEQGSVQPEVVEAALTKQKQVKESGAQESRSVRVDADKLDQLINLVGELIIAGANVNMIAHRAQGHRAAGKHQQALHAGGRSARQRLQLRMVKIGATFNRFQRVVHDVSRDLGKDIVP
jgi:two-component system chemotaxis sensor kinase CheA